MIDAWDVYWVMQLDRIGGMLVALTIISGCALGVSTIIGGFAVADSYGSDREQAKSTLKRIVSYGSASFVFAFLCASMIPSSKTAAAMIVLPAITSDTVVQTVAPEARELYELAKDALRSVAKDKPSKEAEAK